ncbi:hypothetical protein [Tenacibaculum sp. M341]|uniref:hypothetical protein n=1 Tax=Tenacibaculum sp. M341 TaxID=2530339 RepID=UPI00104A437D|nr:hypothetical protein [Tenacibaculum sp. M341]TCI90594.1 hypothetical protein EYW44_12770 [Tenacibaculum sp. M341]
MNPKEEFQKIKELRNKLSIPINLAKELILEHNGDLSVCVQEYHFNNINTICRLVECDEKTAEKYYRICKFNIEKSVKKIHEQLQYLTATPNEKIDKIGYCLWAKNESIEKYVTSRDRSLFIQTKDFDYVIDIFKDLAKDDEQNGSFDICGYNYFDNKTSKIIVQRMAKIKTKDPDVEVFLRNLIKWFNIRLRYADEIIVFGNL